MSYTFTTPPIANTDVKLRWREQYVSEGLNKKLAVNTSPGLYRGFILEPDLINNDTVLVSADPATGDSVLVYQTLTGYSVTIRDTAASVALVLNDASLRGNWVVIAVYANYSIGVDTTAAYRAYTLTEWDGVVPPPEKEEVVVLGTVYVPATTALIPATDILLDRRTYAWASAASGAVPWSPIVRNGGFEWAHAGQSYTYAIPPWQIWTQTNCAVKSTVTDPNSGTKSLEISATAPGVVEGDIGQAVSTPVVPGQQVRVRAYVKQIQAPASGTGSIYLTWADSTGTDGTPTEVSYIAAGTTDSSYRLVESTVVVPAGKAFLTWVGVYLNASFGASGAAVRVDDVQVFVETGSALVLPAGDDNRAGVVSADALLIYDPNLQTNEANAALVRYDRSLNRVYFERKDGGSAPSVTIGSVAFTDLNVTGNTTLGDTSGDTITIYGTMTIAPAAGDIISNRAITINDSVLTVKSTGAISATAVVDGGSANQSRIYLRKGGGAGWAIYRDGGSSDTLQFALEGGAVKASLTTTGQLTVYGDSSYSTFSVANSSAQIRLERTASSTGAALLGADSQGVKFADTSNNLWFKVTSGGAQIGRDLAGSGAQALIVNGDAASGSYILLRSAGSAGWNIYRDGADGKLKFAPNETPASVAGIDSSGNAWFDGTVQTDGVDKSTPAGDLYIGNGANSSDTYISKSGKYARILGGLVVSEGISSTTDMTVGDGSGTHALRIDGGAPNGSNIYLRSAGVDVWCIYRNGAVSNTLYFDYWTGAVWANKLTLSTAGMLTASGGLTASTGGVTVNSGGLTVNAGTSSFSEDVTVGDGTSDHNVYIRGGAANSSGIVFRTGTVNGWGIGRDGTDSDKLKISFSAGSWATLATITTSGSLGIGISPSTKFHVYTGSDSGVIARVEGVAGNSVNIGTDATDAYIQPAGKPLALYSIGSKLVSLSGSNVALLGSTVNVSATAGAPSGDRLNVSASAESDHSALITARPALFRTSTTPVWFVGAEGIPRVFGPFVYEEFFDSSAPPGWSAAAGVPTWYYNNRSRVRLTGAPTMIQSNRLGPINSAVFLANIAVESAVGASWWGLMDEGLNRRVFFERNPSAHSGSTTVWIGVVNSGGSTVWADTGYDPTAWGFKWMDYSFHLENGGTASCKVHWQITQSLQPSAAINTGVVNVGTYIFNYTHNFGVRVNTASSEIIQIERIAFGVIDNQ